MKYSDQQRVEKIRGTTEKLLGQHRTIRLRPSLDLLPQSCSSENLKYMQYSCVF